MRAETRHQLKQDRFRGATLQVAEQTVHWSVEHRFTLIIVAAAVLLVAGVVGGGWYYFQQQDLKASNDLNQALRVLDTPLRPEGAPAQPDVPSFANVTERSTEARKKFQAIVDTYPHTRTGEIARYFLGLTAAQAGDYAAARRELGAVASTRDANLSSLAKLALGSVQLKQGHNKEAIQAYKELADKPSETVPKATAQLELGDALLADMQPLEAKRIFEQVQKENPSTPAAQVATQKLQELK